MQIKKLPLFQLLSFLLFLSNLLHFSHADVGTAARYSPPYLREYPQVQFKLQNLQPFTNLLHLSMLSLKTCFLFSFVDLIIMCSDGVLWWWPIPVSVQQFVRSSWRWDMGQWSIVWEAILGEMHQRFRAWNLCPWPDYPGQDCWLCSQCTVSTFGSIHHCPIRDGF